MTTALVAILAAGAVAFGAVYPWAYVPLLASCALFALTEGALCIRRSAAGGAPLRIRRETRALAVATGLFVGAIVVQLIPLPSNFISRVSPGLHALLQNQNLAYMVVERHPLSINPGATWRGLAFVGVGIALFFAARSTLARHGVRTFTERLCWVALLLALVALVERPVFNGKVYGFWQPIGRGFPFGPFVNHNHFAGWMLLALPLQFGYLRGVSERGLCGTGTTLRERVLWTGTPEGSKLILTALTVLVCAVAVVFSMSRSGICSLVVAAAVVSLASTRRRRRRPLGASLALFVLAVPLFAVAWVGVDLVGRRFSMLSVEAPFRLGIWSDTVRIIRDMPLTGTGFNTFGTTTLHYQTVEPTLHFVEAHNDYLQLASEGGLLLVIPAATLVVVFAGLVSREMAAGCDDRVTSGVRLGAVAGLAAIATQSLVEFSLQMPANAMLFAVVAAVASQQPAHRAGSSVGRKIVQC